MTIDFFLISYRVLSQDYVQNVQVYLTKNEGVTVIFAIFTMMVILV